MFVPRFFDNDQMRRNKNSKNKIKNNVHSALRKRLAKQKLFANPKEGWIFTIPLSGLSENGFWK